MTPPIPTIRTTWPEAAERLARRSTRRARLGRALPRIGTGLLAGSLPALAIHGVPALLRLAPLVPWLVGGGALVGLVLGIRSARRVLPTRPADAAWALDRIAGAHERGLTAATVVGPRGAEAAWAAPGVVPPPRVRLLPPRGLALLVGAGLVAIVAIWVGSDANRASARAPATGAPAARTPGVASGAAEDAANAERQVQTTEARADQAAKVSDALGLPQGDPVDPAEVARRLANPVRREAARRAAAGSEIAPALADGAKQAERVARALRAALNPEAELERGRREAVALRARDPRPAIPPGRLHVVERYFERGGEK